MYSESRKITANIGQQAILCYCRSVAVCRTSWTDANPGRRFWGCPFYKENGGCGFFFWCDPEPLDRYRKVILGLLKKIKNVEVGIVENDVNGDVEDVTANDGDSKGRKAKGCCWMTIGIVIAMFVVIISFWLANNV